MTNFNGRTSETKFLLDNLREAFDTGAYVEKQVGNVTIIGELHAYNPALALDRTADWAHARVVAERASGCIVEKESHPENLHAFVQEIRLCFLLHLFALIVALPHIYVTKLLHQLF